MDPNNPILPHPQPQGPPQEWPPAPQPIPQSPPQQWPTTQQPIPQPSIPQQVPQPMQSQYGPMQPIPPQYAQQAPLPPVKKSKKPLVVFLLVLLLIAGGGAAAFYYLTKNSPAKAGGSVTPTPTPIVAKNAAFYMALKPGEIELYTPATKEKGLKALPERPAFYDNDIYSNQGLQYAKDDTLAVYATAIYNNDAGEVSDVVSTTIYSNVGSVETELLKIVAPQSLNDWVVTPDGSTIYYIAGTQKNPDQPDSSVVIYDLNKFDVATKKSTLIKGDYTIAASRMYITGSKDLRIYSILDSTITEHRYDGTNYTTVALGDLACTAPFLSYPDALSPDGKQLLANCQGDDAQFSYFSIDTTAKTNKKLYSLTSPKESLRAAYWSTDSSQLAFDIAGYGPDVETGTVNNRVDILDLATSKVTNIFAAPAPYADRDLVEVLGWSPDAKYIAFASKGMVNIYEVATKTVTATELKIGTPVNSSTAYGWTQ